MSIWDILMGGALLAVTTLGFALLGAAAYDEGVRDGNKNHNAKESKMNGQLCLIGVLLIYGSLTIAFIR